MTTSVGASTANKLGIGFGKSKNNKIEKQLLAEEKLKEFFTPELINRIDKICLFNNLTKEDFNKIIKLELKNLNKHLLNYKTNINTDKKTLDKIVDNIGRDKLNARYIRNQLRKELEKLITEKILENVMKQKYQLDIKKDKIFIK